MRSTKACEAGAHRRSCAIGAIRSRLLFCCQNSRISGIVEELFLPVELLLGEDGCQLCTEKKYLASWSLTLSAELDEVPGIEDIDDDCVEILAARNLNFWRSDLTDNCLSDSCSRDCGAGVSSATPCCRSTCYLAMDLGSVDVKLSLFSLFSH